MIRSLYKPYNRLLLKLAATSEVIGDHREHRNAVYTSVNENSKTASTKPCADSLACRKKSNQAGFTLIEVLVALSIIAIAFTALLKATSDSIAMHQKLKNKMIREWVAAQGITLIQLGLVQSINNQIISEQTTLFNQHWYWRASLSPTPLKEVQKITLTSSLTPTGPFTDAVIAFKVRASQ